MFIQFQHRGWHYAVLLAAAGLLFFVSLGGATLWDLDEPRNIVCAIQMYLSGDYIVPTFNADLRADKPALLYWLQCLAFSVCGINEFAGRLPSALAGVGTLLVCYELGRSLYGRTVGLLAGLIAGTMPMICGAAHFANPDSLLNFCIVLTMFCAWQSRKGNRWWYAAMGAACGLAVLAKGPIGLLMPFAALVVFRQMQRAGRGWYLAIGLATGVALLMNIVLRYLGQSFGGQDNLTRVIVQLARGPAGLLFPAVAMLIYCIRTGQMRRVFLPRECLPAVATFLLVALPWYAAVGIETKGEFLLGFFVKHHGERAVTVMELHDGSILFYPIVLLIGTAPWSIFIGLTAWHAFRSMKTRPEAAIVPQTETQAVHRNDDSQDAAGFLVSWIATFLLFFSLVATKLPNYILPVSIPCALLTARFLVSWCRGEVKVAGWLLYTALSLLFLLGIGIGAGLLIASGTWRIAAAGNQLFPGLEQGAAFGLGPLIGAGIGCWLLKRGHRVALIWMIALMSICFLTPLMAWASSFWNDYKAIRPLVEEAHLRQSENDIMICGYQLEYLPSLNFYARRDINHCDTPEQLIRCLDYPVQVYLVLSAKNWESMRGQVQVPYRELARHYDLYHNEDLIVVTNR